jgi:hypothetical protein
MLVQIGGACSTSPRGSIIPITMILFSAIKKGFVLLKNVLLQVYSKKQAFDHFKPFPERYIFIYVLYGSIQGMLLGVTSEVYCKKAK